MTSKPELTEGPLSECLDTFVVAFEHSVFHIIPFLILTVLLPAVVAKGMFVFAEFLGPAGFHLGSQAYLSGGPVSGLESHYKAAIVGLMGVGVIAVPIIFSGLLLQLFYFVRFLARVGQEPGRRFKLKELFALDTSIIRFGGLLLSLVLTSLVVFGLIERITSPLPDRLESLLAYFLFFFEFSFVACSLFVFFEPSSPGVFASLARGVSLVSKDWGRWLAMAMVMGGIVAVADTLNGFFEALSDSSGSMWQLSKLIGLLFGWYIAVAINRCYQNSSASIPQ